MSGLIKKLKNVFADNKTKNKRFLKTKHPETYAKRITSQEIDDLIYCMQNNFNELTFKAMSKNNRELNKLKSDIEHYKDVLEDDKLETLGKGVLQRMNEELESLLE